MRATLCAGAVHTLPVLHSALGSVSSISPDTETEKKGPRARGRAAGLLVDFLLCPKQEERWWGWIPSHHGGLPDLPSGLLHPRKCPCVVVVTS